jgi:nucleoside-diphosphate-sugar epimerase
VTGATGPLGGALINRLVGLDPAPKVIAIDTTRRQLPGVTWRVADVRDPVLASRLSDVDAIVHLATDRSAATPAVERRAVNVRGTEVLLDAAAASGVARVVLLTSAMVYGAHPANPIPIEEDASLLIGMGHEDVPAFADGLVGDWLGMEAAARRYVVADRQPATGQPLDVTVVRPASLVGEVADSLIPGLFEAVRLLGIRDARPHWQFCHLEDLLDALVAAAVGEVSGGVTVGCEGWLTSAEVETITGMRSVVLPAALASATADRLHRVGVIASPSSDLDYLVHPWVVGSQRLRATGWTPAWTNEAALRDHLRLLGDRAGRGLLVVDRKEATRAAAGATLAVVGSLALVRARARRR